jgi:hypothetical protein
MELMTNQEQQDQQQRSQGYFTMPEAPNNQEYYDAIDRVMAEHAEPVSDYSDPLYAQL